MTGIIRLPADPQQLGDARSISPARSGRGAAVYLEEPAVYDVQGRLLTQSFTARVLPAEVDDPILGNTFTGVPFADCPGGMGGRCEDGTAGVQAAVMIAAQEAAQDRDRQLPEALFVPLKPWDAIRDVSDAVQ